MELTSKVELCVDGQVLELDITQEHDDIIHDLSTTTLAITINPVILLKYGIDTLLLENITIKLYSNNSTTLNSSIASKDVYGLLEPSNLKITTSTTTIKEGVINEVLEKITWTNPRANQTYVVRYEIIITYNEKEYVFNSYDTSFMMPSFYDANNDGELNEGEDTNKNGELDDDEDIDEDGELDEGETEFGAGEYTIKVRAITDNCNNIANSRFCEEINVTILATPTDLVTQQGNIVWSDDINVEYYLIKVYTLTVSEDKIVESLIVSSESKVSLFDLCNLEPFEEGVYGVTVQAMHNNPRILASKESEMLQVIRLPQVTSYFVDDGELYINAHSFFTKAEIYLTDNKPIPTTYTFEIINDNVLPYSNYIQEIKDWATSSVLETYADEDYYVKAKYVGEDNDATFRTALAQAYSVQIKLYGNTAKHYSIISSHTSAAVNERLPLNDDGSGKNIIDKLVTPVVKVSETERGMLLFNIPEGLNYSTLSYYQDGENSLKGVHLYSINISSDKVYTMYIAEIFDEELFNASLEAVDEELIQDDEEKNYLKHFEYNGITFNVIDKNDQGYVAFNFNVNYYYYYTIDGIYTLINLNKGGSFVADIRFLGDDTKFIKSNVSENATIKRYNVLNLAIKDGVMSWLNQATVEDHPIYLVTLTNELETYNIVLYNPNVYPDIEMLKPCLDLGKTYLFDTIIYSTTQGVEDEYITYTGLANIINKARLDNSSNLAGNGGAFLASVQAHYTNNTATDIILAQGVESKTIVVLPKTQLDIVNGALTWNLSYITNSGGREYIYNYLLQVFDGTNKLYEIKLDSLDFSVSNYVATYQLPRTLNNGEDAEFTFTPDSNYTFKFVALAGDSTTYINSIATDTKELKLLPDLQDVRMENGVLTWTNTTTNSVEVYVSYTIGDALVEFIAYENDTSFELPMSFTDLSGTARQFVAGYDYSIRVRLLGNNNSLNGFYSEHIVTQRLATIPKDINTSDNILDIATNKGVLVWTEIEIPEGMDDEENKVIYTIKYISKDLTTGEIIESGEITNIETNQYDFVGLPSGIILVRIIANYDNCFSSFASEEVELIKLVPPTNIKFNEGTTTISWDKALDHNGQEINHYRVRIEEEGQAPFEQDCNTNEWVISGVTTTNFKISVKSISILTNGTLVNSEYTEPQSMVQPSPVDVDTFVFDETLQAFKWKAIEGENAGDKYYISYNYFAPNSETPVKVEDIEITITEGAGEDKYYYYYPSVIGKYALISVQVVRAGSLSSQPTLCMDETVTYVLDFKLFASGDGVNNPYIISNETHLRNIKYFLNANYEIDANITLTSQEPITNSEQVFTGTINGNNKYIYGVAGTSRSILSSNGDVGLFNRVAGATFVNIQLSGFVLNGYLGSSKLYMGVLVGYVDILEAKGVTKFNNIVVTSTTINLTKDNQTGYAGDNVQIYIGAIAGSAQNSEFKDCVINLGNAGPNVTLYIKGDSATRIYVGAVSGYANNCTITNTNNNGNHNAFTIQYTLIAVESYIPTLKIGALIGESGEENMILSGNSCEYTVYTSQGSTTHNNEIGK